MTLASHELTIVEERVVGWVHWYMECDLERSCVEQTFILWWSSWLWKDANRLLRACWSDRRVDFRQRFAGEESPVDFMLKEAVGKVHTVV
jgi:hypothetical protein